MPARKASEINNEELPLIGIDYVNKKDAIKELEAQCKTLRVPLENYVKTTGRTLSNGSRLAVVSHADVDVHIKQTLRTGKVLLPEAIDVLRANGLDECIENIPTVREDVIERLYDEGKISDEILSAIYRSKDTYAFSVELKERMHDAPE